MASTPLNRDAAWQLLTEYTKSDSLLKHAMGVEAAVRGYARKFGEDEEAWGIVGLLHDFDYERWPTPEDHPFRGCEILREKGYPEWVMRAILSHADYSGVPRESRLEKRCGPAMRWPDSLPPPRSSGRAGACSTSSRPRW